MSSIDRSTLSPLQDLPALPAAVVDLLQLLARDDVGTQALAAKIALDPALSAKTLRLANSSFYGLTRDVSSLADAAAVLGLRTLRSVVTTAALTASVPAPACEGFDFDAFWRHAISVAVGAQRVALEVGADEEAAFTGGLLHDIGRLVLAIAHPGDYSEVLRQGEARGALLCEREIGQLGVDHAEAGALVAEHWRFPASIAEAIGDHHRSAGGPLGGASLAGIVRLADLIAHAIEPRGNGAGGVDGEDDVPHGPGAALGFAQACESAGLASEVAGRLLADTDRRARAICAALLP